MHEVNVKFGISANFHAAKHVWPLLCRSFRSRNDTWLQFWRSELTVGVDVLKSEMQMRTAAK